MDCRLVQIDTLVNQVYLFELFEMNRSDLLHEDFHLFLFLLLFFQYDVRFFLHYLQFLLFLLYQLYHVIDQLFFILAFIKSLHEGIITSSDKFLYGCFLGSILDVITQQEQNNKLKFYIHSKVLNLTRINPITILQIIGIINSIKSLNNILQISIETVQLKTTKYIEIRPDIQVEETYLLLSIYGSLFLALCYQLRRGSTSGC